MLTIALKKSTSFQQTQTEWTQNLKLIILSHVLTKVTLVYANVFKTSRYIGNPIKNFFCFSGFLLFASQQIDFEEDFVKDYVDVTCATGNHACAQHSALSLQ